MVLLLAAGEQGRAPGLCADVPGGCARRAERRRGGALRQAWSGPRVAGLSVGLAAGGGGARGVVGPTVRWSVRGPARCRVDGLFSTPTALADPPHGGRAPLIGGQTAHARHASAAVWLP